MTLFRSVKTFLLVLKFAIPLSTAKPTVVFTAIFVLHCTSALYFYCTSPTGSWWKERYMIGVRYACRVLATLGAYNIDTLCRRRASIEEEARLSSAMIDADIDVAVATAATPIGAYASGHHEAALPIAAALRTEPPFCTNYVKTPKQSDMPAAPRGWGRRSPPYLGFPVSLYMAHS